MKHNVLMAKKAAADKKYKRKFWLLFTIMVIIVALSMYKWDFLSQLF